MNTGTIAQWLAAALLTTSGATYATVAHASGAGLCSDHWWCETPCGGCGIVSRKIPWGQSGSISSKTGSSTTFHNGSNYIFIHATSGCGDVQTTDGVNTYYQDDNYGTSFGGQIFTPPTSNILLRDCF
jgi:hypothetical protein